MEKKLTVIPPSQTNTNADGSLNHVYRVAAYCRVSTEQEEQLGSFANQVAYYTEYIREKQEYQLAGIFADEGISGTGTRRRTGFRNMIAACEAGEVDLVITKSISRFARNTRDCLHYARHLKSLGIPVIFEKEGINTMDSSGELLFTILSSLAQEESRNISENTRWGIRSRFQQGIPHINTESFMGYDKDENGHLTVNQAQAEVVKRIFREFLEGWQPSEIARSLNQEKIPGVHGQARWAAVSILRMLQNEKYKGDVHMQKYYVRDFLTKELGKNDGRLTSYYLENNHEAIIERNLWEAAQLELKRLEGFKKSHGIRELGSCTKSPFHGKIFCRQCGGRYVKKAGGWKCINTTGKKGHSCQTPPLGDLVLKQNFLCAWKELVLQQEQLRPKWERCIDQGNPLEQLRAKQFLELMEREPADEELFQRVRMLLLEAWVEPSGKTEFIFMDETIVRFA